MKMNYRQNHTNRGKKFAIAFFLAAGIAVFYFTGDVVARGVSAAVHRVALPLLNAGGYAGDTAVIFSSVFSSKQTLAEENTRLRRETEEMYMRLLSTDMLVAENIELKEILGRIEEKTMILGTVLSRPSSSPYDTLIIDLGAEKVRIGDRVFVDGNIPAGVISRVHSRSSVVELFSSPERKLDVLVGAEHIAAAAQGKGSGNFEIVLPRDIEIHDGDIVSVPSFSIEILCLIGVIEKDANNPFQIIRCTSPFTINNVKWVEVMPASPDA